MKKILVLHGPNLNMLGIREPAIYGNMNLAEINDLLLKKALELDLELEIFQSNSEAELIDRIHRAYGEKDAILINPAAFTHYSYALADAIAAVALPTIEVHLSDINAREEFRRHSVIRPYCIDQISGLGVNSYLKALERIAAI